MIAGDTLDGVDRQRVRVVDPAVLDVAALEHHVLAGRQPDVQTVVVEAGDGGAHPVVDREPLAVGEVLGGIVAAQHDLLAGREDPAGDLELVVDVELAGCGEHGAGLLVERAGLGAGAGQHQRDAAAPQLAPVGDRSGMQIIGVVGEDDAAVLLVGGERGGDVAVAELIEGGLFPLVLLATVHGQLGDPPGERVECSSEPAAGGDLGKLTMVADEDHFGADPCHMIDDTGEIADAGHAGLVDHDDCGGVDLALFDEVAGDRHRLDPRPGIQLACRPCRRRQPDHRVPG